MLYLHDVHRELIENFNRFFKLQNVFLQIKKKKNKWKPHVLVDVLQYNLSESIIDMVSPLFTLGTQIH